MNCLNAFSDYFTELLEPMEEDDVESSNLGMNAGMSGRGRGMRSGGPGRRVMKLGVGGFFVKVYLFYIITDFYLYFSVFFQLMIM